MVPASWATVSHADIMAHDVAGRGLELSHDIVALVPIVEGAGGVITTWDGEPAAKGGRIIAAGDAKLHAEARALLIGQGGV